MLHTSMMHMCVSIFQCRCTFYTHDKLFCGSNRCGVNTTDLNVTNGQRHHVIFTGLLSTCPHDLLSIHNLLNSHLFQPKAHLQHKLITKHMILLKGDQQSQQQMEHLQPRAIVLHLHAHHARWSCRNDGQDGPAVKSRP